MPTETFQRYLSNSRTIADIEAATAVLGWDQETYMPEGAANGRAEQISTLSALVHQMTTADEYRSLVEQLGGHEAAGELEEWERAAVRESKRTVDLAVKLPEDHVREIARATSLGQHAWRHARAESNFSLFAESLSHLVDLKRKEADYYGYTDSPYDALIDLYEPGMTVAELRPVFTRLREGTKRLLNKVKETGTEVSDSILYTEFDRDSQLNLSREIVGTLGFDFQTGRVDLSAHPFCTSFGVDDVRLTTRILPDDLRSCFFGLIHEAGHGMYEQGIDPRFSRTSIAAGTSMGIHESQSLFWENMVGRSEPFWQWAFPKLQSTFPERFGGMSPYEFYQAINVVQPSLIRIEADELTYNLHILIRFEIEEALINGRMEVAAIPEVWNSKMEEYLGITPPNDARGCLQDIHWSFGGFGYFPSYTLGKLYAAMFYDQLKSEMPDVESKIARGEFAPVLAWLREKIHRWGKMKTASELVVAICGKPLSEEAFLAYNERKIERVYERVENA